MMQKLLIKYGDVAIGAREAFNLAPSNAIFLPNVNQIKQNLSFPNYANPCDLYSVALDGESLPIPSNYAKANLGWWSSKLSDDDGNFSGDISIIATADELYSSIGISLMFDTINNVYATHLRIWWYKDNQLISQKDFYPDNANYFCQNRVEFYNKVIIRFYSINMPQNRLKLHSIEYGFGAEFGGDELKGVTIIQGLSPLSTEISINTCDFNLISNKGIQFSFADRQPVETYFDGKLRSKTFIKNFNRKSQNQWSIKTEDYIGIMQSSSFSGGIYNNFSATELIKDIFTAAKVPYDIEDGVFDGETVTGYIPFTNCREALMQVAFAIGAVVDTSNRENVYIYKLSDAVSQTISLNRIMQGQNFEAQTRLTAFELTAHQYIPVDDVAVIYEAEKSGIGQNLWVRFSNPMHDLSISNGQIVSFGANYAIINADDGCVLVGKKYEHKQITKRKTNPLTLTTDTENIVSVKNATLVSSNNVDKLLEKCYNYLVNTRKTNLRIVEAKRTIWGDVVKYGQKKYGDMKYGQRIKTVEYDQCANVGDLIQFETEYLGDITGYITKQSYSLNGGIIIKDTVVG
jgi:hypothetical protein